MQQEIQNPPQHSQKEREEQQRLNKKEQDKKHDQEEEMRSQYQLSSIKKANKEKQLFLLTLLVKGTIRTLAPLIALGDDSCCYFYYY